MDFDEKDVSKLLVDCQRRCCICHRFCGVKIELHHIRPKKAGGKDEIDNAIALCFDCHTEVGHYNSDHPRGRKYGEDELRYHKERWVKSCKEQPEILLTTHGVTDQSGPLQGLINELEFNLTVAENSKLPNIECQFKHRQFDRAIEEGAIALLEPTTRDMIYKTYHALGGANERLSALVAKTIDAQKRQELLTQMDDRWKDCGERIKEVLRQLNGT